MPGDRRAGGVADALPASNFLSRASAAAGFFLLSALHSPASSTLPASSVHNDILILPDIKKIKDRGALVVALTEEECPPFSFCERVGFRGVSDAMRHKCGDATLAGIDVEIAKILAGTLGVGLDLRRSYASPRAVLDAVAQGEADLGAGALRVTLDAAQSVRFSEPYAIFSYALLVNRNAPALCGANLSDPSLPEDFERAFDCPGCRIGVERGSAAAEQFPILFPQATAVPYDPGGSPADLLLKHHADAILGTDFSFRAAMALHPEQNLFFRTLKLADSPEVIALAVNPAMPALASLASDAARGMRTDSLRELYKEYGGIMHSYAAHDSSPSPSGGRARLWQAKEGGTPEGDRPDGIPLPALGALGVPLLAFLAAWLRMSKRRAHG